MARSEQTNLRIAAGGAESGAAAVLVDCAGADLCHDVPTGAQRRRFALQHKHRRSLGPDRAAGLRTVRAAVSIVGERVLFGEFDEEPGRAQHVDSAGQRHVAVTVLHRAHGDVKRRQRGRARRVHRERRAGQPQCVGDPAGYHAERGPGEQMTAVPRELGHLRPVPGSRSADEAAHVVAGQVVGIDAAVFQSTPGHPKRNALLRVHRDGLARRNTEELWVERRCAGEESTTVVDLLETAAPRTRRAARGSANRGRWETDPTPRGRVTAAPSSPRRCRCRRAPRPPCRRSPPDRRRP